VQGGAEAAEVLVAQPFEDVTIDPVVRPPPKVLVVQSVVLIQQIHVISQLSGRLEIQSVDERMRWCQFGVITVNVHYYRDHGMSHRIGKPFRHPVEAERVVKSDEEFVFFARHFETVFSFLFFSLKNEIGEGARHITANAVMVDLNTILTQLLNHLLSARVNIVAVALKEGSHFSFSIRIVDCGFSGIEIVQKPVES